MRRFSSVQNGGLGSLKIRQSKDRLRCSLLRALRYVDDLQAMAKGGFFPVPRSRLVSTNPVPLDVKGHFEQMDGYGPRYHKVPSGSPTI
jgi:hypothetical protein